jgi:hypothetical protein
MIRQGVSGLAIRSCVLGDLERDRTQSQYPTFADRARIRESSDNIPIGSRRVRVQTVNANRIAKKCGVKLSRRDFHKNKSAV